jgi:phosphate transport system substrate-binding protein
MKNFEKAILAGVAGVVMMGASMAHAVDLNGAGSTFDNPIFQKWFHEYYTANSTQVNYQSIGSGGGIQQWLAKTVDFGATDAFLTNDETQKAGGPALNLPVVLGAVCVSYNIPGIDTGLKLTPKVLVDIYMGKILNWNDPAIVELNPDLTLPNLVINVVRRSDGSGTTNIFTSYLSKVSTDWSIAVGWGKSVNFPVGVGGKGNEGVAGIIRQYPGSIGYVELAYAVQNKMAFAALKNKAGKFVEPSVEATTAAADGAMHKIPSDFKIMITNAAGEGAYPICGFSWVVVRANQDDPIKGKKLVDLLNWMLDTGNGEASTLYYAPLPDALVAKVKDAVATIKF